MSLIELLASIAIASLIILGCSSAISGLSQALTRQERANQELSEVYHALNVMTRSIRQAGFPEGATKFPNISVHDSFIVKSAIAMAHSSGLSNSRPGEFLYRKGIDNMNSSDALSLRHASYGHLDCLGHRITEKRLYQKHAHLGFFVQRQGTGTKATGMLMCQSLDNKGRPQNDGILLGVKQLRFSVIPDRGSYRDLNSDSKSINIELSMLSGKSYARIVTIRHLPSTQSKSN